MFLAYYRRASEKAIPLYSKLKEIVQNLVGDMEIIDALSEYAFYEKKLVTIPVVETTKFKDFQNKCDKFAVYYCYTIQENLSNRFISLPSLRTRILGLQCYRHNVAGFLHWGYNFWNNANSRTSIKTENIRRLRRKDTCASLPKRCSIFPPTPSLQE